MGREAFSNAESNLDNITLVSLQMLNTVGGHPFL
jgi:hypothetical protein